MVWPEPPENNVDRDPDEAPETPTDEPPPVPIEDPPAEPDVPPFVVDEHAPPTRRRDDPNH
jgi:hypothetical protein